MAIVKIQNRRGVYANFDPSKLLPGEFAVVQNGDPNSQDGKALYLCISAGNVKRLMSADDAASALENALESLIEDFTEGVEDSVERAEAAAESIEESASQIAENTSNIANLQVEIASIEPGLTNKAKSALLDCFAHVAWADEHGQEYYQALINALSIGEIRGEQLGNYMLWSVTYPYYTPESIRLAYYKFDLTVTGGKIYKIKANVNQQNLNMYINAYNQNVLDQYTIQGAITQADHIDLLGGWDSNFEHTLIIPKRINGSPSVGLIFGFKISDNSDISNSAVKSVNITEEVVRGLPDGYTAYDYITINASSATITTDTTGYIRTRSYVDVSRVRIALDYLATNSLGTGSLAIIGVRSENNWTNVVCIYITGGANYVVYSHAAPTISNVVTKNKVTHIELMQGNASPSVFLENGTKHEITWTNTAVVNAPLYLFCNPIHDMTTNYSLCNNIQLGQFAILEDGSTPDVYIPVVRNSDNVIGIFNVTTQEFHTCQDTTKAKVGNVNCIYKVGNWT